MDDALKQQIKSLNSQLDSKNKQLVSTSMRMINRDNLLLDIKAELSLLSLENEQAVYKIRKLITKIENELNNVKEWESLESHFDLIHSDFFKRLKEKRLNLTVSEVRLCALLKMQMSTKEIAKFLNLSVRGIETRRYRLRKKIGIPKEGRIEEFLEGIN